MNRIKFLNCLVTVVLFTGLLSCGDMNDTQRDFLDRGEKIYVGKIDSLQVHGGNYRAQITGLMYYAHTAEKCIIKWETDSLIVPLDGYSASDTLKLIINNLSEGSHQFFIQTYDKEGNKSLNESCNGYSYGEQYVRTASPKIISQMKAEPSGLVLLWNTSDEAESVEVVYESNDGDKTMALPGNVKETKLADWKIGGTIKSRTALIPEVGAIDTLYTDWLIQPFPASVEFELDKSLIVPLKLAKDATTGYDGRIEGVFDGVLGTGGNQFHSGNDVGVPQHLTFDLGVNTNLTRFEIWARSDGYNNWNPKKIQFWGIDDITGAEITLPSMDSGWEAEAVAKGWTKLIDGTCSDPVNNRLKFDTSARIRYLIVRTTEVYGGPSSGTGAYVIIKEINLYADSILPVN